MPIHGKQDDVQGRFDVVAVLVAENVKQIIKNVLENVGSVEVLATGDQDLSLIGITGNLHEGKIKRFANVILQMRESNPSLTHP